MNIILKRMLVQVMLITSFTLSGQQSFNQKKEPDPSKTDSVSDFEQFKRDAEVKISENEKKIEVLKGKKLDAKEKNNKRFTKKISTLERKNNKLKGKIRKYSNKQMSKWVLFKLKFNRQIKNLGDALDDMSVEQYQLSQ